MIGPIYKREKRINSSGWSNYFGTMVISLAIIVYLVLILLTRPNSPLFVNIKYMYWSTTTPLLLVQLCQLLEGEFYTTRIVRLDIAVMLCGFFGYKMQGISKWISLAVGVIFGYQIFATILILFTHKNSELSRRNSPLTNYYHILSIIWLVGWSMYVVLWVLGVEGLRIVPDYTQFWGMVVLDFFCKDVVEILISTIRIRELTPLPENESNDSNDSKKSW